MAAADLEKDEVNLHAPDGGIAYRTILPTGRAIIAGCSGGDSGGARWSNGSLQGDFFTLVRCPLNEQLSDLALLPFPTVRPNRRTGWL